MQHLVNRDNPRTAPDFKDIILQHVRNISPNTQRTTVEHTILRFQMVADNGGRHFENVLL